MPRAFVGAQLTSILCCAQLSARFYRRAFILRANDGVPICSVIISSIFFDPLYDLSTSCTI